MNEENKQGLKPLIAGMSVVAILLSVITIGRFLINYENPANYSSAAVAEAMVFGIYDSAAPVVSILSPTHNSQVLNSGRGSKVTVSAEAVTNSRIRLTELYANGTMIHRTPANWGNGKNYNYSWDISRLLPGKYELMLVVFDADNRVGGSNKVMIYITENAPPPSDPRPTVSVDADPLSITTGQFSTISWSSTDATSCSASGGWSGTKVTSGSEVVYPTANTTYSLTCTGSGGQATNSVTVYVSSPTAPTVSLTATPSSIESGSSSTLTWSSTNATTCSASGGWSGTKAVSGTQSVSPTANTTYSLSCTGDGGSANASATVTVTTPTSNKFKSGDLVEALATLNVRSQPSTSGSLLGTQSTGALGTIIGGSIFADSYFWWNVDWNSGADGWSNEDLIGLATVPPPVAPANSVRLTVHRFDGGSGSLTISNGVPLPPGRVTPATLKDVRLLNNGIEQRIHVQGLGRHQDNSYRALFLQFVMTVDTGQQPVVDLQFGTARKTVDLPYTPHSMYDGLGNPPNWWLTQPLGFGLPRAVALPTDPNYLIASRVIPGAIGLVPRSETAAIPHVGSKLALTDERFDRWHVECHLMGLHKNGATDAAARIVITNDRYADPDGWPNGKPETWIDRDAPLFSDLRMSAHPASGHTHHSSYEAGRSLYEMWVRTGNIDYWKYGTWTVGILSWHQRYNSNSDTRFARNAAASSFVTFAPGQMAPYFLTTADQLALESMIHVAYGGGSHTPWAYKSLGAWGTPNALQKMGDHNWSSSSEPRPAGRQLLAVLTAWAMTRPAGEGNMLSGEDKFYNGNEKQYVTQRMDEAVSLVTGRILDHTGRREDGVWVNKSTCNPTTDQATVALQPAVNTFMQVFITDALIRIYEDGPNFARKGEIPGAVKKNLDGLRKYWNINTPTDSNPSFRNWFGGQDCQDPALWSRSVDLNSMFIWGYAWSGTRLGNAADTTFARELVHAAVGNGTVTSGLDGKKGPYIIGRKQDHEHFAYVMQAYRFLRDAK
jgi:hypothetical protein